MWQRLNSFIFIRKDFETPFFTEDLKENGICYLNTLLYFKYSLAHCTVQCTYFTFVIFIDFPSRSNSDAHALKEVRDLLKNDLNKENMEKAVCVLINIETSFHI